MRIKFVSTRAAFSQRLLLLARAFCWQISRRACTGASSGSVAHVCFPVVGPQKTDFGCPENPKSLRFSCFFRVFLGVPRFWGLAWSCSPPIYPRTRNVGNWTPQNGFRPLKRTKQGGGEPQQKDRLILRSGSMVSFADAQTTPPRLVDLGLSKGWGRSPKLGRRVVAPHGPSSGTAAIGEIKMSICIPDPWPWETKGIAVFDRFLEGNPSRLEVSGKQVTGPSLLTIKPAPSCPRGTPKQCHPHVSK